MDFLIRYLEQNVVKENHKKYGKIMKLVRFLLGLLVPPLGVFLTVGVGPTLFINILLTVLGWLPGSIHAIWVIAKHDEQLNREGNIY
ncbi:YqaE/Pmp3 family membrane protein [Nostoc sphaeroides CCNUC1]|uniref:YqaE/Pmp3 family membrane protein n=3 Tax=Nostoc TaxID=1177 RepID=A0A5P8VQN7_9NOSO|nr:YqaE/Pmp3 family membrane protein [Nostoc sphaeroides CCNUC1]